MGKDEMSKPRVMLALVTGAIMLYGATSVAVGIWIREDGLTKYMGAAYHGLLYQIDSPPSDTVSDTSYIRMLSFVMVVIGFLDIMFMLVAFWGLVYYEIRCYIPVYVVTLLCAIATVVILFVQKLPTDWKDHTAKELSAGFEAEFMATPDVHISKRAIRKLGGRAWQRGRALTEEEVAMSTKLFEDLQINEKCCGVNDYHDYDVIGHRLHNHSLVPPSCCHSDLDEDDMERCVVDLDRDFMYTEGCLPAVYTLTEKYYYIIMGLTFAGFLLQLVGIVFAVRACKEK